MENMKVTRFSLDTFKKASSAMIATNDKAYDDWTSRRRSTQLKGYSLDEIEKIINSGSLSEQQRLSENYFYKDGIYRRIIIYYATLLKYSGILIPRVSQKQKLAVQANEKRYFNALNFIDKMDLKNLLTNCSLKALINGTYYGIIVALDKTTFAVMDLPSDYCSSRYKDLKGNDVIEFDLRYFNTIYNEEERGKALSTYPKDVRKEYYKYRKGKRKSEWYYFPTDISICFPLFDGRPLFLNVIPAAIRYDDSVETERARDLEEIKKIIVQKIPHNSSNEFLLEPPEVEELHAGAVGMMKNNKNISILTTYADVDSIASKTSSDTANNNLEKMVQHIYNEGGVSGQIFASSSNSSLEISLENDLALMMYLGNKYSMFVSNLINKEYANSNINFKYEILPITYYNSEKYIDTTLKMANSGYSFILPTLALGFSQSDLGNLKDLENDVLKLGEKLIPLTTSYTQSTEDNKGGAPKKEEQEKADQTVENEESLDNQGV